MEASSERLNELFAKEARKLTESEEEEIYTILRQRRHIWFTEQAQAKTQKRGRRTSQGTKRSAKGVSLDELDLGDLDKELEGEGRRGE